MKQTDENKVKPYQVPMQKHEENIGQKILNKLLNKKKKWRRRAK